MNNLQITLNEFFLLEELSQDQVLKIQSGGGIAALKEKISRDIAGINWPAAFSGIVKNIGDLLNISISDIMISAWNKYRILLKYTDKGKYGPKETFLVTLAEHTIKSEHNPYIEVLLNEQLIRKIDFDISIALTLKGFILKIRDGKIKEIKAGTCKGKGTVKCENFVIFEKETESFSLPGSINFEEGVAIKP
jgi:hypothetical protein